MMGVMVCMGSGSSKRGFDDLVAAVVTMIEHSGA